MTEEAVKQGLVLLISTGCAPVVQWLIGEIIEYKERKQQPVAPQTKRWLAYLVAFEVSSVLYLAGYLLSVWPYSIILHIGAVTTAIVAQQAIHAKMSLPTGEDMKRAQNGVQERLTAYTMEPPVSTPIPQGHLPYRGRTQMPIAPAAPPYDDTDYTNSGDMQPPFDGERGPSGGM